MQMEDEEPQSKRNNFDTNRPTVNYSNLVLIFPRFLDPTMLVNGRTSKLNEVSLSSSPVTSPKTSYIIRSIPWNWQTVEILYYSDKPVITFTAYVKSTLKIHYCTNKNDQQTSYFYLPFSSCHFTIIVLVVFICKLLQNCIERGKDFL